MTSAAQPVGSLAVSPRPAGASAILGPQTQPEQGANTGSTIPKVVEFQGCQRVEIDGTQAFVCVQSAPVWQPVAAAMPGVATAVLGFAVVHLLSVRRQRRDEQFKLVQATRETTAAIAEEARLAWSQKNGRAAAGQRLIYRVAALSSSLEMMRKRDKRFDVGGEVVAFRRAVTNDIETGSVAMSRRQEIALAATALDEAILGGFLDIYG